MHSLTRTAIAWAIRRQCSVQVAGECGGPSRVTLPLLGESVVLRQAPGRDASVARLHWANPGEAPPPLSVLASGVRTPRDLHRTLRAAGYS